MKDNVRKFAEQAGFMLWTDEEWNPGDVVDWSARYDDELEKFFELVINECANFAEQKAHVRGIMIGELLRNHFLGQNLTLSKRNMRDRCDALITALTGKDMGRRWWNNQNKAFDMQTPEQVFEQDPELVYNYLMKLRQRISKSF